MQNPPTRLWLASRLRAQTCSDWSSVDSSEAITKSNNCRCEEATGQTRLMFVCELCGTQSHPHDKPELVFAIREKRYRKRPKSQNYRRAGRTYVRHDPGGIGGEYARQWRVCNACFTKSPNLPGVVKEP